MRPKILVTLGPVSLKRNIISAISREGISLFRINLSHTQLEDLETRIEMIQKYSDIPICIDSEGAQIRNHSMEGGATFYRAGDRVQIHFEEILGDRENISFGPEYIGSQCEVGDEISVDFNSVLMRVAEKHTKHCIAEIIVGGEVGSNKAANINKFVELKTITSKDKQAIEIGRQMNIRHFALSFANCAEDVLNLRKLIGKEATLISKIESYNGLINLNGIIADSNEILIDRGDLSREVSLVKIPFLQRRIISIAKAKRTPVSVATNLLESMITNVRPTRAELNDVVSTLLMGADGLVLAAETAIGRFPLESVRRINRLIDQYLTWTPNTTIEELLFDEQKIDRKG